MRLARATLRLHQKMLAAGPEKALTWDVTFSDVAAFTLVKTVVSYTSAQALQQVIQMGLKEGLTSTLERLDELLLALN